MPKQPVPETPGETRERQVRKRYPLEYRKNIAALVLDQNRSVIDVAKEYELAEQNVYNWVRQEKVERGQSLGLPREVQEELTRLRKEIRQLTMERDLLKKSTAFWVKESTR
jgi:transposase